MTVTSTSSGSERNSGSKLPRMTEGNSVRLTTVSSSDLSSRQRAPGIVRVAASSALRMRCSRSAVEATDEAVRQRLDVILAEPDRQRRQTRGCDGLRWFRWRECRRTPAAPLRRRAASPASAPDAQSARPTCRASTCSSPSRCRQSLSAETSARMSAAGRPFFCTVAARYSPLRRRDLLQRVDRNVDLAAKASAAGVGTPSL